MWRPRPPIVDVPNRGVGGSAGDTRVDADAHSGRYSPHASDGRIGRPLADILVTPGMIDSTVAVWLQWSAAGHAAQDSSVRARFEC
jgi:hypothetical protein